MQVRPYILLTIALAGCASGPLTPQHAAVMSDAGLCQQAHALSADMGRIQPQRESYMTTPQLVASLGALNAEAGSRGVDCSRYAPPAPDKGPVEVVVF